MNAEFERLSSPCYTRATSISDRNAASHVIGSIPGDAPGFSTRPLTSPGGLARQVSWYTPGLQTVEPTAWDRIMGQNPEPVQEGARA